jgi:ATP-dependent Lhr-like helicase
MATDAAKLLSFANFLPAVDTALCQLSPPVRTWFLQRFEQPTPCQRQAWPASAAGNNLLLCAPTGSGKTLAAFLPILDHLLTQAGRGTSCLYVAPQKALAVDVRRNLRSYLAELRRAHPTPRPRIGVRSGDTSPRVRRRLRLRPPDILLTTPESLAVLLAQPADLLRLATVRWLIVDEIHAVAGTKRGADLSLSLERLEDATLHSVQRIGLSATCAPRTEVARFLVGASRPCTVVSIAEERALDLDIELLPEGPRGLLQRLVDRLEPELQRHATTLIFTNARGLAERLTWALRRRFPDLAEQIAVHHSSLAPLRRRLVERRLKSGRLRTVVSSTSLELGVDIGTVELVVLVHPPGGAVRLLQRLGRSGHGPGQVRRGLVLTTSPGELLHAAVTGAASRTGQIEPLHLPEYPLDVLCQHLVGMAAARPCSKVDALALVRRAAPFHDLPQRDFDDCLAYLSGQHRDGRPWLPPRLRWQDDAFTLADARTARLLLRNLGTILADDPRPVRLVDGTPVGTVDEPYADRLQPGDRFLLDGRCLEFKALTWEAALVEEVVGRPLVPRWAGDGWPLSAELAQCLYALRMQAAEALRAGPAALHHLLRTDYHLRPAAVSVLESYFLLQETLSEIPDSQTLLIERIGSDGGNEFYVHTPLPRPGNDAVARVAVLRLARDFGRSASSLVADLGLLLCVTGRDLSQDEWRQMLAPTTFDEDWHTAQAESSLVRERFHRTAQTGLMILRNPLGSRRKVGGADWPERRLFEQVKAADPQFVLLRQAQRDVHEVCDRASAAAFAALVQRWTIRCRTLAEPSPFAQHWTQSAPGPVQSPFSPEDVLRRLHTTLTGGGPFASTAIGS